MERRIDIFCCYSPKDRGYLLALKKSLREMERQGHISLWADTDIQFGTEFEPEIERHLNSAEIILLLISPDFMASDDCYKQMKRAMERREPQNVQVIPIIIRPVDRQGTLFEGLKLLPTDAVPVISNRWNNQDEAWYDITKGIREVVQERRSSKWGEPGEVGAYTVPSALRGKILDFTNYIDEKTRGFVGREFVFRAVKRFTERYPCGYYFIRGDPGIGKSALLAKLVKDYSYVHHFNIGREGFNNAKDFLENVCAQLIMRYKLNYSFLPPEATQNGRFLKRILGEVSEKLMPGEQAIIAIDALDEVKTTGHPSESPNILYLPPSLPPGIYIILTMRKVPNESFGLSIDDRKYDDTFDIKHDSEENKADTRKYLKQVVARPGIQVYVATQGIDNEFFIGHLVEKSNGNFIYLRYVLPEIEHGYYTDLDLTALPAGLQNYYEDHWRRIRGKDEDKWFKYKLPIIMALTVVGKPMSIDLIAHYSMVQERARIREVLQEWAQFLHIEQVPYEGSSQLRYSIYHASFHEFIAKKEEVEDERVSRIETQRKIITRWKGLVDE